MKLSDWTTALADTLLPPGVSAGRPVRLDCDDAAIAQAGRSLGVARVDAVNTLVDCLKREGAVDARSGVGPLAVGGGDPPECLPGLCVLVLAASRMQGSERNTMAAYYVRLAGILGIPVRDAHPGVTGVRELVAHFDTLADWMEHHEAGERGLLDLPADVHPSIVGVPINQSLIRAGDRLALGSFFERASRLIDAGWDPVHQLARWGGRHQLSATLQALLEQPELHQPLAAALRATRTRWDGSTVDAAGHRVLAGQLTLHLPPGPFTIGLTVPALDHAVRATGPVGQTVDLDTATPAAVPLEWLAHAAEGPVVAGSGDGRIRVFAGPTLLFEVTDLGIQSVAAAVDDPVWVLTCDLRLISRCPSDSRYPVALPGDWCLLCDVEPDLIDDDLRVDTPDDEERPLAGIAVVGGLRLADGVWLLGHPPQITADVPEPAPVTIDGQAHGDIETGRPLTLEHIADQPGMHRIEIGEQDIVVELAERGARDDVGGIGFDLDPRRVHAGAHALAADQQPALSGPLSRPTPAPGPLPMIVRYRATVDIIEVDGTVRRQAPPAPAAWVEQAELPLDGPWEIADPERVVWVCVNAPTAKFVVSHRPADVPVNDDVLDVVDWFSNAHRVIDRSGGGAVERWQRLLDALAEAEALA